MAVPALISTSPSMHRWLFCSISKTPYLSLTVASHGRTQGAKVHNSERTLSNEDIPSFVRDEVQSVVDEHMRRWVDQRTWHPDLSALEKEDPRGRAVVSHLCRL